MNQSIRLYKYKTLSAAVAGVISLLFAHPIFTLHFNKIVFDFPFTLILPLLISMAWGTRYSIITGASGGALFPLYHWSKFGASSAITSAIYFWLLLSVGFIYERHATRKNTRLIIVVFLFFVLTYLHHLHIIPTLLTLQTGLASAGLDKNLLFHYTIKNSFHMLVLILISETLLELPIVRQATGLPNPSEKKGNHVIFAAAIMIPLLFWVLFIGFSNVFGPDLQGLSSNQKLLALLIILTNGLLVSKILFYYSEQRIIIENQRKLLLIETEISKNQTMKRFKELNVLYEISNILNKENLKMPEVFTAIVKILPHGWQHSERCAAKIQIKQYTYTTSNYKETSNNQRVQLRSSSFDNDYIEIVYLTNNPEQNTFLPEEKKLLETIADLIQIFLDKKSKQKKLSKAEANLLAAINNTEYIFWSVDTNFNLLMYNKPFERFFKEIFDLEVSSGKNAFATDRTDTFENIRKEWETSYMKVLAGEKIIFDKSYLHLDLSFSLSPIIEREQITGVSIFGSDITERKINSTKLAEANKKIGELKIIALRSAMNPHFIFNALNSIQYFIANNERRNAINYLSTFSKLIREVLDSSTADSISLKREIEMLNNYVLLEKLRFEDKFDFVLEYSEQLDVDHIRIPPLLIQPYIENAILHGLYSSPKKGILTVRIKQEDSTLLFEIEDNGIGRKASSILKERQSLHKSMGTKITEERLSLIKEQSNISVQYIDLMEHNEPGGTLVKLNINIIE